MAFTAVAAVIAGEAVTAAVVLAAIAEVGMVFTVVGAVTGNETLMKIGGVMGLVGGVGALASGAMSGAAGAGAEAAAGAAESAAGAEAASAAAGAAESGVSAATGATEGVVTSAVSAPVSEITNLAENANNVTGLAANPVDAAGNQLGSGMFGNTPAVEQIGATTGMPPTEMGAAPQAAQAPNVTGAPTAQSAPTMESVTGTPNAPTAPGSVTGTNAPYNAGVDSQAAYANMPNAGLPSKNFFSGITDWMGKNKELVNTGVKLVGGMMQGAQQQQNFEAQMNYTKEQNARSGQWAPNAGYLGIIGKAQQKA